jgi:hypothetical protein
MPVSGILIVTAAALCLISNNAMAFQPLNATIRVSSGNVYDYFIIGEHPFATDGYDNAYDTISPGNLNREMGEEYLATTLLHPEWKPALRELRGDIREPAARQQWRVVVSSSLPAGSPLAVRLDLDRTKLPDRVQLRATFPQNGKECDLKKSTVCEVAAPGPGSESELVIIAEQRKEEKL